MKIVLVHGYGTGFRDIPPFRKFVNTLGEENAKVFHWQEQFIGPTWKKADPFEHIKMLKVEAQKAKAPQTHKLLKTFLEEHQPDIVFGHSLGSLLLFEYLKNNSFPKSVKKMVLSQGILDRKTVIGERDFEVLNYYCVWDPTLWAGAIISKVIPGGLFGIKDPNIKNIMYPLHRFPNLHTSSINDERFIKSLK